MALTIGTRVGPYDIVSALGAGGMGEVYRARDARLGRDVAIKVLPVVFTGDPDRLARFEREARLLAALNHPNVAHVYGLEEHPVDGSSGTTITALVMEIVEGETLGDRLASGGPIPLNEALAIAGQIVAALDATHEKGIIHRDLKPANIKITADGVVKVLDFGIAKTASAGAASEAIQPTMTVDATREGLVVGTAAYMSPEQARGQDVDKRTDIWAFGCVLFEMLTGRRAFAGDTFSESIAEVLKADPDWRALPAETPEDIRRLLDGCLRKDRARRLRDIGDARLHLDDPQSQPKPARTGRLSRERAAWATMVVVLLGALIVGLWPGRSAERPPELRLEINTPPSLDTPFALSPDGLRVVYVAPDEGQRRLWVRALDSHTAQPLRGTDGAAAPFWSPDGRSLGFFADAQLKRVNLDDGSVLTITNSVPVQLGGTWNREGTILFAGSPGAPILRTSVAGGEPSPATRFEPEQRVQLAPHFLPDGRHFLFFVGGSPDTRGVYVGQLDDATSRRLLDADGPAVFARATGHLIFTRSGRVMAQAFEPDRLELGADQVVIDEAVTPATTVSVSDGGSLVYSRPPPDSGQRQLVWVDRQGQELQNVLYPDTSALGPALSPDGRRVAVFRLRDSNVDIWVYDVERRTWDRATTHPGDDIYPLWSWDGTELVFGSRRGSMDLYSKRLNAPPGSERVLLTTPQVKFPTDWSRDGRFVLYNTVVPKAGNDVWALPLGGARTPMAVVASEFNEQHAQFSPDGRWIAYQSDKTGRFEVYLRAFPGPGADTPVSVDGGAQVRWHPRGTELFYIASDDRLMAVSVRLGSGDTVELDSPRALFPTSVGTTAPNTNRHQYMVSPDGESFVMNTRPSQPTASTLFVIVNWRPRP